MGFFTQIKEKLVGKYYTITGPRVDRHILVESIYQESDVDQKMIGRIRRQAGAPTGQQVGAHQRQHQ